MLNMLNYEEWMKISEGASYNSPDWREGGIVLIRGNVLSDGYPRLYAGRIDRLWVNDRGAIMVKLQPDIHIILREGYKFVDKKIMINPEIMKRALGLSSYNLALNAKTGKTPIWDKTINTTSFPKILSEWEDVLASWKQFKY